MRIVRALRHSKDGVVAIWRNEQAFRQEIMLGMILAVVLYFLAISVEKKLILVVAFMMLLLVEMLNSAIEALADRVSTEIHPLIKNAKDMGSAAVCMAIMINIIIWIGCLLN